VLILVVLRQRERDADREDQENAQRDEQGERDGPKRPVRAEAVADVQNVLEDRNAEQTRRYDVEAECRHVDVVLVLAPVRALRCEVARANAVGAPIAARLSTIAASGGAARYRALPEVSIKRLDALWVRSDRRWMGIRGVQPREKYGREEARASDSK